MVKKRDALTTRIVREIGAQITNGEIGPGEKLPTEAALCKAYGVSRPTVRTAIKELEVLGVVRTRHGVGTFVLAPSPVKSGLERLVSITQSIRDAGKEPGMIYGHRTIRLVLPDEARRMDVSSDTEVLELRRTVTADGAIVAYSFDLVPMAAFPDGFDPQVLSGSLFDYFQHELGRRAKLAAAEVHAVHSDHIGWGPESDGHNLFILLDQVHFDEDDVLMMYSRSYFVEGSYTFAVLRRV